MILLVIKLLLIVQLNAQVCTKYWVRKEWRELSPKEISNFFDAVKCLKSKPSKYEPALGSTSIYDDMVYIHIISNDAAHKVAAFLPWHRQFLSIFENLLRKECKYNGSLPYWDFAMDSQAPERSPVFGKNAFGGNGGSNGCVTDGAFTNWESTFPQKKPCITRQYNMDSEYGPLMGVQYSPLQIEYMLLYYKKFGDFGKVIEEHPHNMAHYGIGGTMFDPKTATNDPIFWIIHTNVDRIWYTWQQRYPELANTYNGNTRVNSTVDDASVEDMLRYYGLGDDVKVKETFSTESLRYCYVYSKSIKPIKTSSIRKRSFNIVSKFKTLVPEATQGKYISPGPLDRTSDPYKLRYPIQFPEKFLHKKYPPEKVKEIQEIQMILSELVDEANKRSFKSPAALANFGAWTSATVSDLVKFQINVEPFKNIFSTIRARVKNRLLNWNKS